MTLLRFWTLVGLLICTACNVFEGGGGEDLVPVSYGTVVIEYKRGDMSEPDAMALAKAIDAHKREFIGDWNTIYAADVPNFAITVRMLPRAQMPADHPVVEMHEGVPVIRAAIGGGLGYSALHWIMGEVHNYYRWHLGLGPCYVESTPECEAAEALWRSIP